MITVVTLADASRAERVRLQHRALTAVCPDALHAVVTLGDEDLSVPGVRSIGRVGAAAGKDRPHLAAARNLAGDWAAERAAERGAEPAAQHSDTGGNVIIFLDADCLPSAELVELYAHQLRAHPDWVVAGPVTYLPADRTRTLFDRAAADSSAAALTIAPSWIDPHPARPFPATGDVRMATGDDANLFWSLSFATTSATWRSIRARWGGFDESFVGYGGEDTDFGWQLRAHEDPLVWLGGAHAFHLWHPVSSPPWEHLAEIVDNANRFYAKWGTWPMEGWLREFANAGAIVMEGGHWAVTGSIADRPEQPI